MGQEHPLWKVLKEHSEDDAAQPISFFRIKGARDENGDFSFGTTKNSTVVQATATKKGQRLAAEATTLLDMDNTDTFTIRQYEEGFARDFSFQQLPKQCVLFSAALRTRPRLEWMQLTTSTKHFGS